MYIYKKRHKKTRRDRCTRKNAKAKARLRARRARANK